MQRVEASIAVSVSDLKKSPSAVMDDAAGQTVAVLNHNRVMAYMVPAAAYEAKGGVIENIILTACAVVIVFGYLLNPALDAVSAAAAASLF